jgi:VWFA-related protein
MVDRQFEPSRHRRKIVEPSERGTKVSATKLSAGLVAALTIIGSFAVTRAQTIKATVRLVEAYATVSDQQGNPVDGLTKDRFQILDNGLPQQIIHFEAESEDLSVAILIDTTGSMRDTLGGVRDAISNFLDQMRPQDSAAVFEFKSSLIPLQEFTTDKAAAKQAVLRTRSAGETALFDALAEVSTAIRYRPGKKAIVLFTDGGDNASTLRAEDAVRTALKTGAPIFAVAEGSALTDSRLMKALTSVAERTGGRCYRARASNEVGRVFADLQDELKHVYLFSYSPPSADQANWRTITINILGNGNYRIRGKRGYFPE